MWYTSVDVVGLSMEKTGMPALTAWSITELSAVGLLASMTMALT